MSMYALWGPIPMMKIFFPHGAVGYMILDVSIPNAPRMEYFPTIYHKTKCG